MKSIVYFCLILTIVSGCEKVDGTSVTGVYLYNSTEHDIVILPYKIGNIDSAKLYSLQNNQSASIEVQNQLGKTKAPVYFGDYFFDLDSIQIIWDGQYKMTYMIADTFTSTGKYISFNDPQNIGRIDNYKKEIRNETKYSIEWAVIYTFTEQDYLDAKD